jgi:rhodanese-related sulfurtransferase
MVIFGCLSDGFANEHRVVEWIEVHQLDSVIREKNPVIVDLRTPHEFEQGHLAGALNIPVGDLGKNRALLDPYKEKPLLIYCRTVNRSGQALRMIEGRGFKTVYVLRGGYAAFSKSRKPLP